MAIGFAGPLSGPQSVVAVPMSRAVELAVEQFNASRHNAQVGFLAVDDRASADGARDAAAHLVRSQDVVGVVGHKNSDCCDAAGSLYASASLAQITPTATNSSLAHRGWPTFFRVCADNDRQAATAAEAIAAMGVARLAIAHDGTSYGWPLAESVARALPREVVITATVRLPVGAADSDAAAALDNLLTESPDLVYAGMTEVEGAMLARELWRKGSGIPLMGAEGGPTAAFLELAGAAAEGCYHTYVGVEPPESLSRQYQERFGESPSGFVAECYDAAGILLLAIARCPQPTRESVLREIRLLAPFRGATGEISFDVYGNRIDAGVSLWRAHGGRMRRLSLEALRARPGAGRRAESNA